MDYSSVIHTMAASILKQLKAGIDTKSHSDKTFTARVTAIKSAGTYQVEYCGVVYTASASFPCSPGDYVRVCAPCNRFHDLFIICKTK